MAYKITYNHPAYDKDHEFDIRGIGIIKNGDSVTLDDEAETTFIQLTGMTVKDKLGNDEHFHVDGSSSLKKSDVDNLLGLEEVAATTPAPVEEVKS